MKSLFATEVWDCPALKRGEVVGRRWRVDGYLGRGGGGAVYHVSEIDGRRSGALKIFCGDLRNDTHHGADRIRQEGAIIEQLQRTRGMPALHERGRHKGRPYFVREDLTPVEPEDLPSDDEGLSVFLLHLLYSLKALHGAGWVHCDVKPWNIARRSAGGLYVLIDFGSAHRIEEGEHVFVAGQTLNTINGVYGRCGTLGYDAPENAFTVARDIYGVGHVIRDCFAEDVPLEWGIIINKCISNNPRYRYASVDALIADIVRLKEGKLRNEVYWPLRKMRIREQRENERSLADAQVMEVELQELLRKDEARSSDGLTVFCMELTRSPRCRFKLRDPLVLNENTVLIVTGKGILDADISGPSSSVVVVRAYAALNNLTKAPPPENDLTYVMVGPGSYLNFPNVASDDYRRFFPNRRRVLRDLDATTSFRFGGPASFAEEEEAVLGAVAESAMPACYKDVLTNFFRGDSFTVMPKATRSLSVDAGR